MNVRRLLSLTTLICFCITASAGAAVLDEIAEDFKPLSGYVIMSVDDEFLIDKDAASGVVAGDIFSVVVPGEKIVHPVTKEVLGTLDEVEGFLRVTRLKSGYSYARAVSGDRGKIEKGDVIRRYANTPAIFWDYTGEGEGLFGELKAALPHLEWQGYDAAQAERPQAPGAGDVPAPALIFILRNDGLEVRNAAFQALRTYPSVAIGWDGASTSAATAPAPVTVPGAPSLEARLEALEKQQIARSDSPIRLEEKAPAGRGMSFHGTFPGYDNLGRLKGVVRMADFTEIGGRLLMATTNGDECRVYAVEGETAAPLAQGDTSYPAEILALHWWRPQDGVDPMLAVTAWSDNRPSSALFSFRENKLVRVSEFLPYLFGAFDRDGDGRQELLLGQSYAPEEFFGVRIHELRLSGDELDAAPVSFELPRDFTVQGATFADITGDGAPETVFVRHGFLRIHQGEKEIYRSPKELGGSLAIHNYAKNPEARDPEMGTAIFEVPPVAADLDGDGSRELIAPAADRSAFRAPGLTPGISESWLAVFKYRDGMFVKGQVGDELDLPLAGLHPEADRILFILTDPPSMLGSGGASHLFSYPLSR